MTSLFAAASAAFPMLQQGFNIDLNWLGHFVRIIVEGVGIVGLGVVVFTLILKAITTPFDIYQRVKMRKQSLIMRQMQPELEKLQKQYANDKSMYNAKMMELQKKNGYSIFGACLPMIISFVILIVAVTAFQSYAQYANLAMYRSMAQSYNEAIRVYSVETQEESTVVTRSYKDNEIEMIEVKSTANDCYIYYSYEAANVDEEGNPRNKNYWIDLDKFRASKPEGAEEFIQKYLEENEGDTEKKEDDACVAWFREVGAKAAAEDFRNQSNPGFLWIKNVWYPDVSYQHPIQDYEAFTNSITGEIIDDYGNEVTIKDVISEYDYNSMTAHLTEEKSQPNGYFILIVLTIGLMVLSQFIMMKSQKETNKFQTVDGQGARTQKIMLIVMPLIYAITGFLWTAAFSIYIAVSSLIGIAITLISNLILGRIFRKKEEEEIKARYTRTVPWKTEEGKKNKKKK